VTGDDNRGRAATHAAGIKYLSDLAAVAREVAPVIELAGWKARGRAGNSGYLPDRPDHVMVHHTASGRHWDGPRDANYLATGAQYAPLSNLYVARAGTVYVLAAGPTNTNGKGSDSWGGGVRDDDMNRHAIGIEAGNDGVGEPWPGEQVRVLVELCAALCDRYAIPTANVRAHHEWAPGRKIDPAGPSPYAAGRSSWEMATFRADVRRALDDETEQPEDENVLVNVIQYRNESGKVEPHVWLQYSGGYKVWCPPEAVGFHTWMIGHPPEPFDLTLFMAAGPVLPNTPRPNVDDWGRVR
jgi:hypothetical protein